ncbi:MAG: hypothetical protein AAGI50_08855 [Pseudomonadota bacterium]
MKILEALELMERAYKSKPRGKYSMDTKGVQARLYGREKALVIEGTNEFSDWLRFNFNVLIEREPEIGDSGARYHQGFYNYAEKVYYFAKPIQDRIDVVIGHSLGAAAAQIVGASLGKPTLSIGAPKPYVKGTGPVPGAEYVTNLNRDDDAVTKVPGMLLGFLPFEHIGHVWNLDPKDDDELGEDHRVNHYIDLIKRHYAHLGDREVGA